jgi:glycosyltransferase involved in cell wall biosynthesis
MSGPRLWANRALDLLLLPLVPVALVLIALIERVRTGVRRRRGLPPRLVWGPTPIINAKYWHEALRRRGYESTTCVWGFSTIHARGDWDHYLDEFRGEGVISARMPEVRCFIWTLRRGDVFCRFFEGGFLRQTRHEWLEAPLLKLAGKKLIVSPYGSDIAVVGSLGYLEAPLFEDYPILRERSEETKRWVHHTLKWADVVIRNWQFGYLPRWDVTWLTELAIDTDEWSSGDGGDKPPGPRDAEVSVLHAPNHRHIKGTKHLERAIADLREEGLPVRLEILEGKPNTEIRRAMAESDILADQFLAGYALFAVEGMSMGRPLLANLDSLPDDIRASESVRECPIVDTDPESLEEDLRRLISDAELRREVGRASREFALRYHSYEAVADGWEKILAHVWRGEPLPEWLPPPGARGSAP